MQMYRSSIVGPGRSPGGVNGNPLQQSCLENPMDSLAGYCPWGPKESDTTERLTDWLYSYCKKMSSIYGLKGLTFYLSHEAT